MNAFDPQWERRIGDRALSDSYSLEAQERNVVASDDSPSCCSSPPATDVGVVFRHSGWTGNRDRIREALERCDAAESRLNAWDGCGANAWVLRAKNDEGRLKVASSTCKDRFCVPCADTRSAMIGNRIRDKIPPAGISFLTLTMADSTLDLVELIDKLVAGFRRLRQWRLWKDRVAGGVAFIEIKWNAAKQRWHPHVHAIIEASFLPQAEISAEWLRITATSFIVHIKRPRNAETVIRYVTKYGSKPLDQSFVNDPERLDQAITALKGRHLCLAFGGWRGWALHDDDEQVEWQPIATLWDLLDRERRGDPEATAIMEALRCSTRKTITAPPLPRSPPSMTGDEPEYLQRARHSASHAVTALRTGLGTS